MENKVVRTLRERVGMSVAAADPATFVDNLVRVEDAGVDHIWIGSGPPWSPDLLTTLANAAARTTHLKLGTAIVQVYSRHPVLMAQQMLSLSQMAPGRLRLGIGTGSPVIAKNIYGIDMPAPLAYLREYVQVLRPLLEQGQVQYQGRYFTVDISLHIPSQVPLLMATLGPKAFQLAGEIADGALPVLCPIPYLLNTAIPALHTGAAISGHSRPPVIAHLPVVFTTDRATALQVGRQTISFNASLPNYRNMFLAAGFSQQEIATVSDSMIEKLLIFGDESKIRDRIQEILSTEIDELTIVQLPVSDPTQEQARLAQLIGQL